MAAVASSSFAPPTAASSSTSRLEPLLLVARSIKPRGAAAASLVHQAISTPGIYFLGELFDVPGVAELATSSQAASDSQLCTAYQLLTLFAYGTYQDYIHLSRAGAVPELPADQLQKLRQLTLLSLARRNKFLPYSTLHDSLGVPARNTRELEDLIIETIYAGLISGKLNELQARFEVHHVQGRDVPLPSHLASPALTALPSLASSQSASQLDPILTSLESWQATTASVLTNLQARMDAVRSSATDTELHRQQHHQAFLHNLVQAQQQLDAQQQQQQQQQHKGKGKATAMQIDDVDTGRAAPRKKAAVAGARGSKRSRA